MGVFSERPKSGRYRMAGAEVSSKRVQKKMGGKKLERVCMGNSLKERVGKRKERCDWKEKRNDSISEC